MIKRDSFILVSVVLISALILAALTSLLNAGTTEKRIANSQFASIQAYNLAEGAIQHAVWRLKNDPVWSAQFISNPTWQATLQRNNVFTTGDSYSLNITNEELAHGTIIATSSWPLLNGSTAQRVVKVKVFKALGTSPLENTAVFGDNAVVAQFIAIVNVALGKLHSNKNFDINFFSSVQVQATTSAVGTINTTWWSTLTAPVKNAQNFPPAGVTTTMPQIEFDSAQPTSLKNQATAAGQVYTEAQFATMLSNAASNPNGLIVNGVAYVTGAVDIKKGYKLTVNGVLAADGQIKIGQTYRYAPNKYSELTINHTAGQPSGLFSKGQIQVGPYTTIFNINGIIYANDRFYIFQIAQSANINGAIIGREVYLESPVGPITITKDNDIINDSLGLQQFSPIISVDHWEEEY